MVNGLNNVKNIYNGFISYNPYQAAVNYYHQNEGASIFTNPLNHDKNKEEEHREKTSALTKAIVSTTVAAGILGVLLAKGGSSRSSKYLNKLIQKADNVIYRYQQKANADIPLNILQKTSLALTQGYKNVLKTINALNNFTAFKDSGVMWLSEQWHFKKACDISTKCSKAISVSGAKSYHKKARSAVDNGCAELRQIVKSIKQGKSRTVEVHGVSKPTSKWAEEMERLLSEMESSYYSSSGSTQRLQRVAELEESVKGLRQKVHSEIFPVSVFKKDFWTKHFFTKEYWVKFRLYRTEALSTDGKQKFTDDILNLRRTFSNNITDNYNVMADATESIRNIIKTHDDRSLGIARQIANNLEIYNSLRGEAELKNRSAIIAKIKTLLPKLEDALGQKHYSDTTRALFKSKVDEINFVLNKDKKGYAEDIETILKKCFGKDDKAGYAKAKKVMDKMTFAVKKAYDQELNLHTRIAELEVGSAPTDVIFGLVPIAAAAYAVGQADTKEDKIAASFKTGIPMVLGIGTSLVCATRMMSNLKSIGVGLAAGLAANLVGNKANEYYLEYRKKQLFTQKAIAEYNRRFQ